MTKIKATITFTICSVFSLGAIANSPAVLAQQTFQMETKNLPVADASGKLDLGAPQSNTNSEEAKARSEKEKEKREKEKERKEKEEAKFKELAAVCENLHKELGLDEKYSKMACEFSRRVYQAQDQEIIQCIQNVRSIPGVDLGLAFACFHQTEMYEQAKIRKLKENLPQCLQLTSQQSAGMFWTYEELSYLNQIDRDGWRLKKSRDAWEFPKTRFEKFYQDCAKMELPKDDFKSSLELVGVANFNSKFSVAKKNAKDTLASNAWIGIGGLSGLALDSTGSLVAISDEKRTSYLHRFQRVLKPSGNYSLNYMDSKEIQVGKIGGSFDFEDLFIQPDGKIWLSTDIEFKKDEPGPFSKIAKFFGGGDSKDSKDDKEGEIKDSFIIELDPSGKYLRHITTPDELVPTYGNVEVQCPTYQQPWDTYPDQRKKKDKDNGYPKGNPANTGTGNATVTSGSANKEEPILLTDSMFERKPTTIGAQSTIVAQLQASPPVQQLQTQQGPTQQMPAQQTAPPPPPPPAKCYHYKQTKGVLSNSAVEAFTVDPRRRLYWVSSEHPTAGQNDIRIYEMDMTTQKVLRTLTYPMAKDRNNGLTSMMYYNDNLFLTVERAYTWGDKEARVNVYLSRMNSTGNSFDKTVLISHEMIKAKMAPGFTEVDNFEGITVGPSASPGKKMIYLVSDSNFNSQQRSVFLMYEVPEELLK